jgi:hypothetical protein
LPQEAGNESGGRKIQGKVIVARLENLVRKIKLQSADLPDIDFRVFAPQYEGGSYIVEVSKGRFSRRVPVDMKTVRALRVQAEHFNPQLLRELRTAMTAVMRLASVSQKTGR